MKMDKQIGKQYPWQMLSADFSAYVDDTWQHLREPSIYIVKGCELHYSGVRTFVVFLALEDGTYDSFDEICLAEGKKHHLQQTQCVKRKLKEIFGFEPKGWLNTSYSLAETHQILVEQAIADGKDVPQNVLDEYPDLVIPIGKQNPWEMTLSNFKASIAVALKLTSHIKSISLRSLTPIEYNFRAYSTPSDILEVYKFVYDKTNNAFNVYYNRGYNSHYRFIDRCGIDLPNGALCPSAVQREMGKVFGTLPSNYTYYTVAETHKIFVNKAIQEGKPIPKEVIEEYPDLVVPKIKETPEKMSCSVIQNLEKNGVEIHFALIPSAETIQKIEAKGFRKKRYSNTMWYAKFSESLYTFSKDFCENNEASISYESPEIKGLPLIRQSVLTSTGKVPKKLLRTELDAGKLEYARYKRFNGMIDMDEHIPQKDIVWRDGKLFRTEEKFGYEQIGHANTHWSNSITIREGFIGFNGYIDFSDFYFRYKDSAKEEEPKYAAKSDVSPVKESTSKENEPTKPIAPEFKVGDYVKFDADRHYFYGRIESIRPLGNSLHRYDSIYLVEAYNPLKEGVVEYKEITNKLHLQSATEEQYLQVSLKGKQQENTLLPTADTKSSQPKSERAFGEFNEQPTTNELYYKPKDMWKMSLEKYFSEISKLCFSEELKALSKITWEGSNVFVVINKKLEVVRYKIQETGDYYEVKAVETGQITGENHTLAIDKVRFEKSNILSGIGDTKEKALDSFLKRQCQSDHKSIGFLAHRNAVVDALQRGEAVPTYVLSNYRDFFEEQIKDGKRSTTLVNYEKIVTDVTLDNHPSKYPLEIFHNGKKYRLGNQNVSGTVYEGVYPYIDGLKYGFLDIGKFSDIDKHLAFVTKTVFGDEDKLFLPNGEEHRVQYVIIELDAIKASHDEKTFAKTEGFPTDADGRTVNDRNYETDNAAQLAVFDYARNLKPLMLLGRGSSASGTPIIKDLIVISGNNRTMSLKLAKSDYPQNYAEYKKELIARLSMFGIDKEAYLKADFSAPVLVRVDNDFGAFVMQNFAKYNANNKKGKSEKDKNINLSVALKSNILCQGNILELVSEFETLTDLYASSVASRRLNQSFIDCGVYNPNQAVEYFYGVEFSDLGKNTIESVLAALVFDAKTIEILPEIKKARQTLVGAISHLTANAALKENNIIDVINDAISMAYSAKKAGLSIDDFSKTSALFGDVKSGKDFSKAAHAVAKLLDRPVLFKKALKSYNSVMTNYSNGSVSMFQDTTSKEEAFNRFFGAGLMEEQAEIKTNDSTNDSGISEEQRIRIAKAKVEVQLRLLQLLNIEFV